MLLVKWGIIGVMIFVAVLKEYSSSAQSNSVKDFFPEIKIIESAGPSDGYFFMGSKGLTAEEASHYIAVIDNYGTPVFFRKMNKPTSSFRLLEDGRMAYLNGVPRKLYFLNKMLEVDEVISIEGFKPNGHDWDVSKDGNILLMGQSKSIVDMSQIVEGGNSEAEVLDLVVQEFDKDLNLIYSWNSADHFEITDGDENSSYLDFTEKQIDYVHANGISIDSDTSFLISCRHMNEITKVNRRTGNIIWRLGGKKNEFQFIGDDLRFSHQHSIRSLKNGHILLFDNGNFRSPLFSSAVEYSIDEKNRTATLIKRYSRFSNVYSNHQGATQRVHNGNTIINWGPYWPSLTEFHEDGTTALEWDFTKHSFCPRIEKYKWQTQIFETNLDSINFGNWESDTLVQTVWVKNNTSSELIINTIETRTEFFNVKNKLPIAIGALDSTQVEVWFNPKKSETGYCKDVLTLASDTETERIARQIKVTGQKHENSSPVASILNNDNLFPVDGLIKIHLSEPVKSSNGVELNCNTIDNYIIFKKQDSDGEIIDFNATISTNKDLITIYPDDLLEEESIYFLALKNGLTDYSENYLLPFETVFNTVITGTSENILEDMELRIFPNPVSSVLKIEVKGEIQDYSIKIYNTSGILLKESFLTIANSANEIDISNVPNGMYLIVINKNGATITKKIIKN